MTSSAMLSGTIDGLPILDGRLLRPDDPVFASCVTLESAKALARRLRGQFAVVARNEASTIAITDLVGSRPMPVSMTFRDDGTKPFLCEVLAKLTGICVDKVSSPSPTRWWSTFPDVEQVAKGDKCQRPLIARLAAQNVMTGGRSYRRLLGVTALGRWVREHGLSGSVIPR
ncbi:MAG TPA: hypothetical protein VK548_23485 [Candidatus Acidoferrum sp.]|nr:hypothetical protein [Candidatus Acidoferrum sp.]